MKKDKTASLKRLLEIASQDNPPNFQRLTDPQKRYLRNEAENHPGIESFAKHLADKALTHGGAAGKHHPEYLNQGDVTLGAALVVAWIKQNMRMDERQKGTDTTKAMEHSRKETLRGGMMKYFAVSDLWAASEDKLRDEYDRGTIAKDLAAHPGKYFDDGECPYSRKTLESREVGRALKQLIREKQIPPEPPPRRPRRK